MRALRAPFPWFGGKSRAASLIWEGLGEVENYVEPFAGSLAVLLARPHAPSTETVNDLDCYLANFWRALAADPEELARHADWPVNEADLHARHRWLVEQDGFRERMRRDPEFYDARVAGWWVWGLSMWIGGGWRSVNEKVQERNDGTRPQLVHETGIHAKRLSQRLPKIGVAESGNGSSIGGVHASRLKWRRGDAGYVSPSESPRIPQLSQQANGRGIRKAKGGAKRPLLGGSGGADARGVIARRSLLLEEFHALAARLRDVRVCCGEWTRILTPSVTTGHGMTGVVLDPPYDLGERAQGIYAHDGAGVSAKARAWAIENGDNPLLRIALCGYEGEHAMPTSWRVREWKAAGGFGSQRRDRSNANAARERVWFSPACLVGQSSLFEQGKESVRG